MKRSLRSRIAALPLLVAMALVVGCSTSPMAPEQPLGQNQASSTDPSFSSSGELLSSTTQVVTTTVNGLVGGTVKNGNWSVKIPAGAFLGLARVSITVPDPKVNVCDLSISPLSLNNFLLPVTLSFKLPSDYDYNSGDYVMRWWNPNTKTWVVISSTTSSATRTCEAPLSHFSTYSCGKAGW